MKLNLLASALAVVLVGCATPSPVSTEPRFDPTGTWNGTWSSDDGATGEIEIEFFLREDPVGSGVFLQSVALRASGESCGPAGDEGAGSYDTDRETATFFVTIKDSGVSFTGHPESGELVGLYTTAAFGGCPSCGCDLGQRGMWRVARTPR